jgi:Domain of unknown function (DUF4383)
VNRRAGCCASGATVPPPRKRHVQSVHPRDHARLVYLAVWLYGLVIDLGSSANFIALNTADNWLHFALGVGMVAMGALASRGPAHRPATA